MAAITVDVESVPVSEARAKLPELLTRVEGGDAITITRHGRAVAILVPPELWHRRSRAAVLEDARKIREMLDEARAVPLPATGGLSAERAEELVAEIRADREGR
jgi:prevent-host-death family protein